MSTYTNEYYTANKQKIIQHSMQYYIENRQECLEYMRDYNISYYQINREHINTHRKKLRDAKKSLQPPKVRKARKANKKVVDTREHDVYNVDIPRLAPLATSFSLEFK